MAASAAASSTPPPPGVSSSIPGPTTGPFPPGLLAATCRSVGRVLSRQRGGASTHPGIPFQAEIKPWFFGSRLACDTSRGVCVLSVRVQSILSNALGDGLIGSTGGVNGVSPPHGSQLPGVLDRQFCSPLGYSQDSIWTQNPEIGRVPRVERVPDVLFEHRGGSSQPGQEIGGPIVGQVCWVPAAWVTFFSV